MRRVAGRIALALAFLVLATLLLPAGVRAHAFLVSSSPAAGERLRASPPALRLQFTEALAAVGSDHLALDTATHRPVTIGAIRLRAGGTELVAALPRLPGGIYVVNWTVVSADDGHPSAGQFAFAVGSGGRLPGVTSATTTPTDWWDAIAEWILLLNLAIGGGGLVSVSIIWQPLRRMHGFDVPHLPMHTPLAIGSVASAIIFLRFLGTLHPSGADPGLVGQALVTRAGSFSLAACALLLFASVASFVPPWRYAALFALLLATLATALRTHPAATASWWGAPAIAIHLTLAVLWSGALFQLVLVFWRQREEILREAMLAAVRRYAKVALWTVIVVLLSGLAAALSEVQSVGELATTGYGLVLLVKGLLVVVALQPALLARVGALRRPLPAALGVLRGLTRAEAIVLVAVLAASALLSNVAPPFAAPQGPASAAGSLLGPPPPAGPALTLAGKAGWLEVYVTASAGQLTVRVVTPDDEATQAVALHLAVEEPRARGSIELFPSPCGSGCFTMRFRWPLGPTRLQLRVGTKDWSGGQISFVVPWPPLPSNVRLLKEVIARMQAQPTFLLTERTSSTPTKSFAHTFQTPGRHFVSSEPYTGRVSAVRPLPPADGLRQLVLYLPGSGIWVHLWIDSRDRIRREIIVDPGHLIVRRFSYPGGEG